MAAGARKVNWFAIWVSVAVVVVLIVVGAIVWAGNSAATSPGEPPKTSAVNVETGAISVGEGPDTVDTYLDFMCPVCAQFEQAYGPTLEQLVTDGEITLNIHPISILDRASQGTEYSTRAANAAYCVAEDDSENVLPFVRAMFENQPTEGGAGLDDAQIVSIAQGVGAGESVAGCIESGEYERFVSAMTEKTPSQPGATGIATPTIAINGEVLSNQQHLTGDPQADIVARLG